MNDRRFALPAPLVSIAALTAGLFLSPGPPLAIEIVPTEERQRPEVDSRLPEDESDRGGFILRRPTRAQLESLEKLADAVPGLTLRWDGMSGSPSWVSAPPHSALCAPSSGPPAAAARAFLESHAELFGLDANEISQLRVTSTVPAPDGGAHVHFTQTAAGLEVFGATVHVNLRKDGAVRSLGSRLFSGIALQPSPALDATAALRMAVEHSYADAFADETVLSAQAEGERLTIFAKHDFGRPPRTRLVLFPVAEGARLAWEVTIGEHNLYTEYLVLVDAADGQLLFRTNLTSHADVRVLTTNHPEPQSEEFAPEQHQLMPIPISTPESPAGWIAGAGSVLTGNNAVSHVGHWTMPGLAEPNGVYDYPYNSPASALANAWYWSNDAHDRFYALGFDEAAGNFQVDNFGNGGAGNDPMHVAVYSAHEFSAWYAGGVDGTLNTINFGWMRCLFCADHDGYAAATNQTIGERSSALMRDAIFHEYTHGVVLRIVGGPAAFCLNTGTPQGGALSEGWADIFPATFFSQPKLWDHLFEGSGWGEDLRQDLSYGDLCRPAGIGCQPHSDGMIWTGALWDVRRSMVAMDPANGQERFERILVEGLANTPCTSTLLDARDGLMQADTILYDSAHHAVIWNAFAARGMGSDATTTGNMDTAPVEGFSVPGGMECTPPAMPTGVTTAADGANAIRVDYAAAGAAAVEIWRDDLNNWFDRAVPIGSTNDLTTFLDDTVQGGKSYRYHVVALGSGGAVCRSTPSATDDATATGDCNADPVFEPQLTVTEGNADCNLTLSWTAAVEGCPGSGDPIVYNVYRAPTPGFEPSERLLIGRTTATGFQDRPQETSETGYYHQETGDTYYYLVLAQHGTLADAADHRDRGSAQILDWEPGLPTNVRETRLFWDFDAGPAGWTADVTNDPDGGWVLVVPSPSYYAGALLAPDEAAGGSGMAWVTGDAGAPGPTAGHHCRKLTSLSSPTWDGTDGSTILSFDYWTHNTGALFTGIELHVDNGMTARGAWVSGLMTVPTFETDGRHGWQRAEFDLAALVDATSTMSVTFRSFCESSRPLNEFGIDNVRVERATSCSRSSLFLQDVTIDDTPPGWGNGNGALDPGETARLTLELLNDGSETAVAPVGTLTSVLPGLLVHEDVAAFPDILPGGTAVSLGNGFTITLPKEVDCNGTLPLDFDFVDASGTSSRVNWNPEFGSTVTETVFEDSFLYNNKGWTVIGTPGLGRWQWGDPVGTMDGGNQANPEFDSPNDPDAFCYVTENGPPGGDPNDNDVDRSGSGGHPRLFSPYLDLTGYKRARLTYDRWYYDNSPGDAWQDFTEERARVEDGFMIDQGYWHEPDPTAGWVTTTRKLEERVPMVAGVRVRFRAKDQNENDYPGAADHIVEMGVDNVLIEGEYQTCSSWSLNPPDPVGSTLLIGKSGGGAEITWQASPINPQHDAAVYYELYVSGDPDAGFAVADTTTLTSVARTLDPVPEFYKVTAVNAGGTSGDEPAP